MAKPTVYSYSRLKSLSCLESYVRKYVQKEWGAPGIEAVVGIAVHKVIEDDHKSPIEITDGMAMLSDILDQRIKPRTLDVRKLGVTHWRTHAMKCLANYYKSGRVAPEAVIGIERKIGMPLLQTPMASFMGVIDRAVKFDGNNFEVQDFKSGKVALDKYFQMDHQLPLYAELLRREYELPEDIVIPGRRLYLAENKVSTVICDAERRAKAVDWARKSALKAQAVEADPQHLREKHQSALCDWCHFKKDCFPTGR